MPSALNIPIICPEMARLSVSRNLFPLRTVGAKRLDGESDANTPGGLPTSSAQMHLLTTIFPLPWTPLSSREAT